MCRQGGRARGGWLPVCVRALVLRRTLRLAPLHGAAVPAVAARLGSSIMVYLLRHHRPGRSATTSSPWSSGLAANTVRGLGLEGARSAAAALAALPLLSPVVRLPFMSSLAGFPPQMACGSPSR